MAGSGDKAEDKENWFIEAFGVHGLYTPENPIVSEKGAVVTNIADIPTALTVKLWTLTVLLRILNPLAAWL